MNDLEEKYGKDTVELVDTISKKLETHLKTRSYHGVYAETSDFRMVPSSNVGLFVVKFPNAKPVAIGGIDMMTGEYILKSEQTLPIYKLDGLDMKRLIDTAESEWAATPQAKRNPSEITDLTIRF